MRVTISILVLLLCSCSHTTTINSSSPKDCGRGAALPFGSPTRNKRTCADTNTRNYTPKFQTIGHKVLDIESEACGVPDIAYKRLDEVILEAVSRLSHLRTSPGADNQRALAIVVSREIGNILEDLGFKLYISPLPFAETMVPDTETATGPVHMFDCDTGSLLYLSITQQLELSTSLVEMTLQSGRGHNFIRWNIGDGKHLDWDVNARGECHVPDGQPGYQGVGMSDAQVLGYIYGLRAFTRQKLGDHENALIDYRRAVELYPESPVARDGMAWMIVTNADLQQPKLLADALQLASQAVAISATTDNLDTLACAHAANGDFFTAKQVLNKATTNNKGVHDATLARHLSQFQQGKNCVEIK